MIRGGIQSFTPKTSGTIIPASLAKSIANNLRLPKLAAGGIVTSPTFALIGEGLNPEVVMPLSELPSMLGLNTSSQPDKLIAKTRGKDYFLILERQRRSNRRLS